MCESFYMALYLCLFITCVQMYCARLATAGRRFIVWLFPCSWILDWICCLWMDFIWGFRVLPGRQSSRRHFRQCFVLVISCLSSGILYRRRTSGNRWKDSTVSFLRRGLQWDLCRLLWISERLCCKAQSMDWERQSLRRIQRQEKCSIYLRYHFIVWEMQWQPL